MSAAQSGTAPTTETPPRLLRLHLLLTRLPPAVRPYLPPLALYGAAKLTGLLVFARLLTYIGWVGWSMGGPGAYFALQRDAWAHYFDFGVYTLDVLRNVAVGHGDYLFAYSVPDLIAVQLVAALPFLVALLLRSRPPLVLTAYTLASIVTVLGTQQMFGNTPRYLLPVFPLLLAPAAAMSRLKWPSLLVFFPTAAVASGWYAHYVIFELGIP
ncbi:hypothetical protein [Streptomyces sasae]|uniref:hypothetical protein n=1 Tax=Streptomyces sasae TaxID=1266772 RepID=UPI00292FA31F|nr:hypothetical protein [Streptomyces sasae]